MSSVQGSHPTEGQDLSQDRDGAESYEYNQNSDADIQIIKFLNSYQFFDLFCQVIEHLILNYFVFSTYIDQCFTRIKLFTNDICIL